jgi:hypothetical protein
MYSPPQKHSFDSKDETSPRAKEEGQFSDFINYSTCMKPNTDKVYKFKSRRFDFCRRESHKNKMVMIIQFEGVIGDINRKSLTDENLQLELRHGVIEGLRELLKNF